MTGQSFCFGLYNNFKNFLRRMKIVIANVICFIRSHVLSTFLQIFIHTNFIVPKLSPQTILSFSFEDGRGGEG